MVLGKVLGGAAIAMLQGLVFLFLGWLTGKIAWFGITIISTDAARAARRIAADVRDFDRAHCAWAS